MGFKARFQKHSLPPEGWNPATLARIEDVGKKKSKETNETHQYLKFYFYIELPNDATATVDKEVSNVIIANDPHNGYQDSEYYKLLTRGFGIKRKTGVEFDSDEIEQRRLQVMIAHHRKKDKRGFEKVYAKVTDYRTDRDDVLNVTVVAEANVKQMRQVPRRRSR